MLLTMQDYHIGCRDGPLPRCYERGQRRPRASVSGLYWVGSRLPWLLLKPATNSPRKMTSFPVEAPTRERTSSSLTTCANVAKLDIISGLGAVLARVQQRGVVRDSHAFRLCSVQGVCALIGGRDTVRRPVLPRPADCLGPPLRAHTGFSSFGVSRAGCLCASLSSLPFSRPSRPDIQEERRFANGQCNRERLGVE
ncbi:hypothetical protein Y032_0568g47 [Ancylostoma ceylanicum]|uniref:Uncharacterized protein n=1 Tax=Ancylostoma ceylanicum TaxID=53326 RepID=A0A016WPD0_9BILA|nr:hypothetical protein Y032_0568g47 [Ancylostoma ceylanicum]